MWWLIGGAPDFWGSRGPRFESGISHKDPDTMKDLCVIKLMKLTPETRRLNKAAQQPKKFNFFEANVKKCK